MQVFVINLYLSNQYLSIAIQIMIEIVILKSIKKIMKLSDIYKVFQNGRYLLLSLLKSLFQMVAFALCYKVEKEWRLIIL